MLGWDVDVICNLETTGTRAHITGSLVETAVAFELQYRGQTVYRFQPDDIHCINREPGYRVALFTHVRFNPSSLSS